MRASDGLSQRQKSALFQKEAIERSEKNICVFRIIEAFQGSSMSDVLGSIVPGPQPKVVLPRVIQGRKVLYRLVLDPQVVVLGLPPHILAVLLGHLSGLLKPGRSWAAQLTECDLTDTGPLEHVTRGAAVLVMLLEVIPKYRGVHTTVTADPNFVPMVVDLVQAMLLTAAGPLWQQLQQQTAAADRLTTGRAICGCVCWGAALLVSVWGMPGPDAQGASDFLYGHVARQLVSHPQGAKILRMLLDAASTMLLTLHQLLQVPSLTQSAQEELSIHSGGALHHIGQLFSHPLMYNAAMLVSPGGRHISRLLMSACCLSDLIPDNAASREAIVPLLVARCNSLLVQLSEFRSPPVLDTLCASAPGKARMHYFIATACRLAQRTLSPVPFPEDATELAKLPPGHPGAGKSVLTRAAKEAMLDEATGMKPGEPQLLLSLMRLFELAADDSALRDDAMEGLAGVMGQALAAHPIAFAERWCGGDMAVTQHLDDLVQVVSYTSAAVKEANRVHGVSRWLVVGKPLPLSLAKHGRVAAVAAAAIEAAADVTGTVPQEQLQPLLSAKAASLERALLLFKLLGNLHFWAQHLPPHQEQRFVRLMVGALVAASGDAREFSRSCSRICDNMRALERFLEPVCPDEESGDDSADVLLTQVEVNVYRDLRRAVASLAKTAWQRRDLPVPKPKVPGAVPDEEPEQPVDLARLAPARLAADTDREFDEAAAAAAAAVAAAHAGYGRSSAAEAYHKPRASGGSSGVFAAAAAAAAAALGGVKREAPGDWDYEPQKRPRVRGAGTAYPGMLKPPPRNRPPGYGGGGRGGSSGRRAAHASAEDLTEEDLRLIHRLLSGLPQDAALGAPLAPPVPADGWQQLLSGGGSGGESPVAAAGAGGGARQRSDTGSEQPASEDCAPADLLGVMAAALAAAAGRGAGGADAMDVDGDEDDAPGAGGGGLQQPQQQRVHHAPVAAAAVRGGGDGGGGGAGA